MGTGDPRSAGRRPGRSLDPLPRLAVAGASGRLGRAVIREALERGFRVTGAMDRRAARRDGAALPVAASNPANLGRLLDGADVFLTATSPEAERANLPVVARAGVPAVVATTGLEDPTPSWLERCADRIPIVRDANFSPGMSILRTAVRSIGRLPEGFDLSIVEAHRRGKPDHPSGTARSLVRDLSGSEIGSWREASGRRSPGIVEIASLRGGETPGTHLVQIAGRYELLRFEHIAYGREAFASGMLLAACWLHRPRRSRRPGIYALRDVLEGGTE